MKKLFVFFGIVLTAISSAVSAQEVDYIPEISLDMRGGFKQDFSIGSGRFTGDELYLDINGIISPNISYSLNHRIAAPAYGEGITGFDATNWLTFTYETENFSFTAGKDAIFVGSFEYDAYDLDSYYEMNSEFYNNFDCWQWGISASWYPAADHMVLLQIANSPYSFETDKFAFAAGWRGGWEWYESYWTANLWGSDYDMVKAANLGNRFYLGNFTIDLDLMLRFSEAYGSGTFILAPSYQFGEWGRAFLKAGADFTSELNNFIGGGFEYFPIQNNKDIRLHAVYTFNNYTVGHMLNIGLTWKMNLTAAVRKLLGAKED